MREVNLTPDQLDAVDVSKRHLDACVVAGPGSGKTTVLVEYFHQLVAEGVDPLRILAITFTEKAAGNMREKLAESFKDDSRVRARLERAWVSTVHGFCGRLLRENAVFAGVDPEFYVADERESWRLQQEAMAKAMEEVFAERPQEVRALIRGLSSPDFEEDIRSAYDAMRGAGIGVERLDEFPLPGGVTTAQIAETLAALRGASTRSWNRAQKEQLESALEGAERVISARAPLERLRAVEAFACNLNKCKRGNETYDRLKHLKENLIEGVRYRFITELYATERRLLLDILCRFDHLYRERKQRAGALDFSDLEEFAVRLLEDHPETRARLQGQFDHILMDEFQDTNGQQSKLLSLVRSPDRFYAVGDINQSIYGFRHAEPEGFRRYRDEVERGGKHVVDLIDNFRSRSAILSAVETITAGARGIEPRSLVAGRKFDEARPVAVELLAISGADEGMEARWVARRILELLDAEPRFQFQDVALLVRNTEVLGEFTAAFDEARIPYLVNRGKGFYDNRDVNDLSHLLRVIANPRDEVSLATVLRSPLVGVSDEALLRLKMRAGNIGQALGELTPAAAAAGEFETGDATLLGRFVERLKEWRLRRQFVSFDRLLLTAMDDCGYLPSANIDKFLAQVRDAAARMPLDRFVEELAALRASNPRESDAPPEDSANAVKVMTVHSAKGLEFPIVFVATLHKGIDPKMPVVAFSRQFGLGARWRNPVTRKDKNDLFQHAIHEERKRREEEESNRLFYVAMTRAEEHLVLSFTRKGKKVDNWAETVATQLKLDVETPRDEVASFAAPDGKPWNMRLLVTNQAAPAYDPRALQAIRPASEAAAVEMAPAPALSGLHDTNVTVTALSKFAHCPREYYLGHYLGFEGRPRKLEEDEGAAAGKLPASEFGTQVHQLLAGLDVPNVHPEAVRLSATFRQSPLGRRTARAARVEREFDFLMSVGELIVRGQVDLWFEEGGEVVIVDYKTDAVSAVEAHQRARDYTLQLRLYAMAVEQVAGRVPERAWLHFLRPNTAIAVDLTPSLLESPDQLVQDFQEAQERMEFPLNQGEHCRRCPFFQGLCPAESSTSA